MNLKEPGAILPLGCAFLSTWAKTVWGVVATPFGELGLWSNNSEGKTHALPSKFELYPYTLVAPSPVGPLGMDQWNTSFDTLTPP